MKVEVKSPAEYVGVIIRDLNARRAVIQGQHERNDATIITATAPLANLLGYSNTLRALSVGRASSVMTFSHYEEVTPPTDDPGFRPAAALRA
jgi:elongation factor G